MIFRFVCSFSNCSLLIIVYSRFVYVPSRYSLSRKFYHKLCAMHRTRLPWWSNRIKIMKVDLCRTVIHSFAVDRTRWSGIVGRTSRSHYPMARRWATWSGSPCGATNSPWVRNVSCSWPSVSLRFHLHSTAQETGIVSLPCNFHARSLLARVPL